MKDFALKTFNELVVFTLICIMLFFGVHFDIQAIAAFLVATIFSPILSFYTLQFSKKFSLSYFELSDHFPRTILLQRIDPLLN